MTYPTKTKPETRNAKRLETNKMMIIRRIADEGLQDKMRSEEISHMWSRNINTWAKHREGKWNKPISRMSE